MNRTNSTNTLSIYTHLATRELTKKPETFMVWAFKMEEEVGFEPTERSHVRRFSRPLQSTALALLRVLGSLDLIILY